nr:MAG TPA: PHD finger family protein [Caudoviricetes sp.]
MLLGRFLCKICRKSGNNRRYRGLYVYYKS